MPDLEEEDFPRLSQVKNKHDGTSLLNSERSNKDSKRTGGHKRKLTVEKGERNEENAGTSVWANPLSVGSIEEGQLLLGFVREVHDFYIVLEASSSVRLHLPAINISDSFIESAKASGVSLSDIFVVGQALAVKVVQGSNEQCKGKRQQKPVVSCNPKTTNYHLSTAKLCNGLSVNVAIESIEEKGVIADFGLSLERVKGFIPYTSFPPYLNPQKLIVGQVILSRVHQGLVSDKNVRVVRLSAVPEMESLDENIVKSLTLNHLMPGTILHGEPCSKTRTGVIVSLGNGVKGYVSRNHLPPRLRDDMSRIKKGFRIVVMACQQNSHLLILNAHPDVLALSKPEKRSSFESIGIGDIIACTVKSITKKGAVNFIPERNGGNERGSLITARAESSMLSGKLEDYDVNSTHECRVIDFRMVERELIVATNKSLLTCKLLTMHDATAGDLVTAYVKAIKPKGIEVKVANKWHGFIPLIHVSDKPFTSLEKRFSIKQPLECRILNVDIERGSFLLTAKPSLVKNSGNIINSYSSENVGTIATGMVVSIKEGGGLVFEFFGGVRGFMMAREAVRLGEISIGISVQVRIVNVEPEESRMLVAVADMTLTNDSVIYRAKPVSNIEDSALTYFAKVVGSSKIGIGEKMREKVDVIVKIGKKKEKTWVASELMSDNLDPPFSTLSDCIRENAKLSRVAVLGQAGGMLKVTCKRFLIGWLETHPRIVRFEDLEEGSLVCGTVSQRHGNQGYFVELAGGSALVGLAPISNIGNGKIAESELQIGQTVVGRVSKLNKEKCQFSLDLRSEVCTPKENEFDWWKFGSDLVESALDEINWFRENNSRELDMPKIGDWMEMTVAQAMHDIVMVESIENKNLKGFIRLASLVDRGFKKGQKVYAVVIDISFPSCELQLYLPERVSSQGADKKKRSEEFRNELLLKDLEYDAHIVLVKRDYVVAVTCSTDSSLPSIAILPSRYHPNDYLRTTNDVRFKCGEFVKVRVVATAEQVLICRATSDIASHLEGNLKRKKTKLQSLSSVKRLKPFVVYTAKVIGEWRHCGENACSVELDAGDGSLGRLHASELSSEYLVEGQQPVKEFLRKNTGKQVNIKVIGIGKIKEKVMMKGGRLGNKQHEVTLVRRVAECTLRPEKISNVRRKQSILGYKQSYDISSVVPVFVRSTGHAGVVRVEASPIFHGVIRKQNLDDRKLKVNPTDEQSALIDLDFEPGEMILARVIGISKARKDRCLELSVVETTKIFEPGHCVTGRVISTTRSPSAIILELSNGQRALLPPTGITGYYKEALSLVEKCLVNEIYQLKLLRFDKNSGRWIAATETRYDGTDCKERSDEAYSPLIVDDSPLKEGTVLNAFISSVSNGTFFAELGPGVVGRISKQKTCPKLELDQLVTVRVQSDSTAASLRLVWLKSIVGPPVREDSILKVQRKRGLSSTSECSTDLPIKKPVSASSLTEQPEKALPVLKEVKMKDPGFDWSLKGFTAADMAAVGETIGATDNKVKNAYVASSMSSTGNGPASKKQKTKDEAALEHEKELLEKEQLLMDENRLPSSEVEFDRLIAGRPNSSELWIRYISFFCAQKDIVKAREIAERALTSIYFRQEEEIFNVWTAYLNLEFNFGSSESLKAVFDRAIRNSDAFKMHKQLLKIYQGAGRVKESDELLEDMLKRFRHGSLDVWFLYGQHLMDTGRPEKARQLMKKATTSVEKQNHVFLLSRFAQMEYKSGDPEQGKTIFESILNAYPKKADIWSVYIDMVTRRRNVDETRRLFERVTSNKFSTHKMRSFFKKWLDFEKKFGDDEHQNMVKERAVDLIDVATKELGLD